MAAFASMAAAEVFAKAGVVAKTYIVAHSARTVTGTIAVRVLNPTTTSGGGNWSEVTDDGL